MKLEVPDRFEDVAVTFSEEEWTMLSQQEKELHKEVMKQNFENMISLGYTVKKEQLLVLIKSKKEDQVRDLQVQEALVEEDHQETFLSECGIPKDELLLILKADEDLSSVYGQGEESTLPHNHLESSPGLSRGFDYTALPREQSSPKNEQVSQTEGKKYHLRPQCGKNLHEYHTTFIPQDARGYYCQGDMRMNANAHCCTPFFVFLIIKLLQRRSE